MATVPPQFQDIFDALSESDQAAVLTALDARVTADANLDTAIATLRQWAADARNTTVTSGNAVAVLGVVVQRLGTFFDRFADLLTVMGRG